MGLIACQFFQKIDDKDLTYWHLHGFRTGRGDEQHEPPPIWQWRNWRAWRNGSAEGGNWTVA